MSGGGTALSVSRRRIELLVNKHSLTAALSCFIPVLQGSFPVDIDCHVYGRRGSGVIQYFVEIFFLYLM